MLYYAGVIQSLGEVHKGDTVMDYMDQERERVIYSLLHIYSKFINTKLSPYFF